jgi:hypothetical protein
MTIVPGINTTARTAHIFNVVPNWSQIARRASSRNGASPQLSGPFLFVGLTGFEPATT